MPDSLMDRPGAAARELAARPLLLWAVLVAVNAAAGARTAG